MNQLTEAILTIVTGITGVAVLALLVSPKAKTSEVIQAAASGYGNSLAVAISPVTGADATPNLNYPGGGMFQNFNNY
jgi:hypothetical protein